MLDLPTILEAVRSAGGTAAFDADGTLWADDIGEAFLRDLEAAGRVPGGTWRGYEARLAADVVDAYGWAVTVMAGLEEAEVRERAEAFFPRHFARRLFPVVRELVEELVRGGVRVAIVSASNRWLIEAAARALRVPHVAGVEVEVEAGRLTDRLVTPLPALAGKVHWARTLLGGAPALAVGNGAIDLPLLQDAAHRLVICPSDDLHTTLAAEGRRAGWQVLALDHPCSGEPLP
ncbi:HAD family hydrolase [Vulgatibacter sp.]|uniref:HAD family hydrolase n=1 Tax=Vulgatibacter sp. TaxID=1971226 RepID=UPI0035673997